jgi:hypothetical protein
VAEILSNRIRTNLNGSINNSVTSLTVDDASHFPATGDFRIKLTTEIMKVTGVAGNVFTVVRAAEVLDGVQTAVSHADDEEVRLVLSAGALAAAFAPAGGGAIQSAYASRPVAGTAGRIWLPTDSIFSAYDSGSDWKEYYGSTPVYSTNGWPSTWVNQGTATKDVTKGGLQLHQPALGGDNVRCVVKTAPATPYIITVGLIPRPSLNGHGVGIGFRDSVGGKLYNVLYGAPGIGTTKWNSPTSWNNNITSLGTQGSQNLAGPLWLQIEDNGTNRIWRYSTDGIFFFTIQTASRTDFFTADQVGVFMNNNSAQDSDAWFISWREQ